MDSTAGACLRKLRMHIKQGISTDDFLHGQHTAAQICLCCANCIHATGTMTALSLLERVMVQYWVPYSRLFWRALKLANWSKNVIGEF